MMREYPEEFDELKQGVLGLVSQEICNRITTGELKPKNNLERAYFFYYLNHLCFAGVKKKGIIGMINQRILLSRVDKPNIEKVKAQYRGILLPTVCKDKSVDDVKANFRGMSSKVKINANYKGINPKTTRPYTNNDCGLLTPLDLNTIERLRYVNLTTYDFRKCYRLFYEAFYKRKGLEKECFIYADPPYPGTEKYYESKFKDKMHLQLIELALDSPFHFMLSMGGDCELYLDIFKEERWNIKELKVKYSRSANFQYDRKEYLITNYDLKSFPKMIHDNQKNILDY